MKRLNIFAACVALGLAVTAHADEIGRGSLFGTIEYRASSHADLPKWGQVLAGIAREQATYEACAEDAQSCPSRRVMSWMAAVKSVEGADPFEQIRRINEFVNQREYRDDASNWGRSDYWATPLEFMRHSGDCEDYVIAKYVSLRMLGVPAEAMRMVVLKDTVRNLAHAVLAVEHDGDVLILDNLTDAVLSHRRIKHYEPYYSVNEVTRWAHVTANQMVVALNH
ncbi:MAG: transglutaminase-like cysteine peptidase [Pseudomonadota bacterium]